MRLHWRATKRHLALPHLHAHHHLALLTGILRLKTSLQNLGLDERARGSAARVAALALAIRGRASSSVRWSLLAGVRRLLHHRLKLLWRRGCRGSTRRSGGRTIGVRARYHLSPLGLTQLRSVVHCDLLLSVSSASLS